MQQNARTFATAMLFETGLGFLGWLLAAWAEVSLSTRLEVSWPAVERGLVACAPMLICLVAIGYSNWPPLVHLRKQVETLVREVFGNSTWFELALICFAAGLGEELLFRGALQPWLARWTNPTFAIVAVGLLFGLAHSLSLTYFVAATLIGCYFGWLAEAYDDLVAPIVAHAVYDFAALMFIRWRIKHRSEP
jgi:membrane protease YdiL (CAAX protease family)